MINKTKKAYDVTRKAIWITLGTIFVLLGIIGIPLPLLPTTPFLLLAVFCFGRGSEKLRVWLMEHPRLGPPLQQWHENRAISRRNKMVAVLSMGMVFILSVAFFDIPAFALIGQAIILGCVGFFLLTRPNPPEIIAEPVMESDIQEN